MGLTPRIFIWNKHVRDNVAALLAVAPSRRLLQPSRFHVDGIADGWGSTGVWQLSVSTVLGSQKSCLPPSSKSGSRGLLQSESSWNKVCQ